MIYLYIFCLSVLDTIITLVFVIHKSLIECGSLCGCGSSSGFLRGRVLSYDGRGRVRPDVKSAEDAQDKKEGSKHKDVDRHENEENVRLVLFDFDSVAEGNQQKNADENVEHSLPNPGRVEPEQPTEGVGHKNLDGHNVDSKHPVNI